MTVDSLESGMSLVSWSLENGIWDGRPISDAHQFTNETIQRIFHLAIPQDSADVAAYRMAVHLAFIGASFEEQQEIIKEALELGLTPEGMILQAGFGKSIGKFWRKHTVAICVGIAVVAVVTVVAVATITSGGVAAGVIAAAGAAANTKDKPKISTSRNDSAITYAPSSSDQISMPPSNSLSVDNREYPDLNHYFGSEMREKITPEIQEQIPSTYNPSYVSDLYQRLYLDSLPTALPSQPPFADHPTFTPGSIPSNPWANCNIPTYNDSPSNLIHAPVDPVCSSEPLSWVSSNFVVPGTQKAKTHISWMNGILNTAEESKNSALYLQDLVGGHTIHGIYNHSNGWFKDAIESLGSKYLGISPITAFWLKVHWKNFHLANADNPNLKTMHVCHSQGALHAKNALLALPQEIRDRVIIVVIAPAAIIPKRLCFQSYNYASERDIVYKFDSPPLALEPGVIDDVMVPRFASEQPLSDIGELVFLPAHSEATWLDHEFQSPTYRKVLQDILVDYDKRGGEYLPEEKGGK